MKIYLRLVAAEPAAKDHRRAERRILAQREARQSPLYFAVTVSWSKDISTFHTSHGAAVQRAGGQGDRRGEALAVGLLAEVDQILRGAKTPRLRISR